MTTGSLVHYERQGDVAVVCLHHPPVNAFNLAVRRELLAVLHRAECDLRVRAIVLCGRGRGFSAGADLREFGTADVIAAPRLALDLQPRLESLGKPVVASLHGFAIGGGLETALACHGRVAAADTVIALPEVTLGIIPLSGTQRLPRLLGVERATAMILSGRRYLAADFMDSGLFDRTVSAAAAQNALHAAACERARELAERGSPFPLARQLPIPGVRPDPALRFFATQLAAASTGRAQLAALEAIVAATEAFNFEAGLMQANAICEELLRSALCAKPANGSMNTVCR